MLTLILNCDSIDAAQKALDSLDPLISAIELRVDYLTDYTLDAVNRFCQQSTVPVILTLRNQDDGGRFCGSEVERQQQLIELGQTQAQYIDVEDHVPTVALDQILKQKIQVIRSHHNFDHTTNDLATLFHSLQYNGVSQYKIATQANSSLDSIRMLLFCKQHPNLSAHCMGEDGLLSRYLATFASNPFIYSQATTAPVMKHIPSINDFKQFRLQSINQDTALYALIGDPIRYSPGMQFHNQYFEDNQINARYINIRLQENELQTFLDHCQALKLHGLSVTIPLKQAITKKLPTELAAINTVRLAPTIECCNTDGAGTIEALLEQTNLGNKSILILGAGGTASGIAEAFSASSFSCQLFFHNRTVSKAEELAARHDGTAITDLNKLTQVDIIINTLPPSAYQQPALLSQLEPLIDSQCTVMDVNYRPTMTPLLQLAERNRARQVFGNSLFKHQAYLQQQFWHHSIL